MHRNERPTRGYVRYFNQVPPNGGTSEPERIDWKICAEVVGISVSISDQQGQEPVLLSFVDLQVKVDAGKDSLGTDGQGDIPIPFSHFRPGWAGPSMAPWLRWVNNQEAFVLTVRNRDTRAPIDACVTIWVREGVRAPKEGADSA